MRDLSSWVLVIILNFISYFIARFGLISNGKKWKFIYFFGLFFHLFTFVYGFLKLGLWGFIILIPVSYFVVRTAVTLLVDKLENKLFPYRKQIVKNLAEKLNKHPENIKEQWTMDRFKTDDEIFDEGYKQVFGKSISEK